jgi:hypothetical protein
MIEDQHLGVLTLSDTWFTSDTPVSVMNDVAPPTFAALHVPRPLVGGGSSRGDGLIVIFRESAVVRRHLLVDEFCPVTFELQLVRIGLPPRTAYAVFRIYRPQRMSSAPSFVDEPAES